MITKKFGIDFFSSGGALTLDQSEVTNDNTLDHAESTKIHPDGWTISGYISEDYFVWVNEFEATHPVFGKVWGNFEEEVYADSEEGFQDFYKNHEPDAWDYGDI